MKHRIARLIGAALAAAALGACSSDGNLLGSSLTTSSVDAAKTQPQAARIDPACIQLTARIDALRREGFVEGVEKASSGKSATVQVKRASLAKMTELQKANAEFQARCSSIPGTTAQATTTPLTQQASAATPGSATSAAPR